MQVLCAKIVTLAPCLVQKKLAETSLGFFFLKSTIVLKERTTLASPREKLSQHLLGQ